MSLPVHRQRVLAALAASPQDSHKAELAFRQAEEALQALAGLGHRFHLATGSGPDLDEWPKKVFHLEQAPLGRHCASVHEFWDLGPDWFYTLKEAQQDSGLKAQAAGRGGIFTTGLPALSLDPTPIDHSPDRVVKLKSEFLANKLKEGNEDGV